jgi:ATP-dependent DNA ligase
MMPNVSKTTIPFTPPMECPPVANIPEGEVWVYELKLDGYRASRVDRLESRSAHQVRRATSDKDPLTVIRE